MTRRFLIAFPGLLIAAIGGASAQEKAIASVNPLSSLSFDSLEATRSLPLFSPLRSPPPVYTEPVALVSEEPAPMPEAAPMPPPLDLLGVVTTGTTELALLRDRNTGEFRRLSRGEAYEGWSIAFVDARTVEFRSGDQVQALRLFDRFDADPFGVPPELMGLPPAFIGAVPGETPPDPFMTTQPVE
ncbi:MAG: hypothetical protein ACRED5_21235 [Propylenella sp.]